VDPFQRRPCERAREKQHLHCCTSPSIFCCPQAWLLGVTRPLDGMTKLQSRNGMADARLQTRAMGDAVVRVEGRRSNGLPRATELRFWLGFLPR
jgi:hypothetical protein